MPGAHTRLPVASLSRRPRSPPAPSRSSRILRPPHDHVRGHEVRQGLNSLPSQTLVSVNAFPMGIATATATGWGWSGWPVLGSKRSGWPVFGSNLCTGGDIGIPTGCMAMPGCAGCCGARAGGEPPLQQSQNLQQSTIEMMVTRMATAPPEARPIMRGVVFLLAGALQQVPPFHMQPLPLSSVIV